MSGRTDSLISRAISQDIATRCVGTELALGFDESNADFPAIDCARLHVEALADTLKP